MRRRDFISFLGGPKPPIRNIQLPSGDIQLVAGSTGAGGASGPASQGHEDGAVVRD